MVQLLLSLAISIDFLDSWELCWQFLQSCIFVSSRTGCWRYQSHDTYTGNSLYVKLQVPTCSLSLYFLSLAGFVFMAGIPD